MSYLDQAKEAATNALNTATNLAQQAANHPTTAAVTEQAKNLGAQAHQQAHSLAPNVVPAPAAGVDKSSDLKPDSAADRAKLENLLDSTAVPEGEGPGSIMADHGADLKKSLLGDDQKTISQDHNYKVPAGSVDTASDLEPKSLGDRATLEAELATKPKPEALVQEGVLKSSELP